MSLKTVLGLQAYGLTDEEIVEAIQEAKKKHLKEVEFVSGKHKVCLKLSDVNKAGLMRGYDDYYKSQ